MPQLALILAMALWASTFVVLKIVFAEIAPLWVICARMWIASLALLAVYRRWGEARYERGDWRLIASMSLAEPCLYFMLEAEALRHTSAGQAGMITATFPLIMVSGAMLFLGERASPKLWLGIILAFIGVLGLSLNGSPSGDAPNPTLGNALELGAMICAAVYMLLVKRLVNRYSPLWLTVIQALTGALFFLPVAILSAPIPESISLESAGAMLYLGLGVTLGAYGLYNVAMVRMPAARVAAFVNLIPLFSLLMALIFLDERLSLIQWLASGLVLVGVAVSQAERREP